MGGQRALLAFGDVEIEGEVVGIKAVFPMRDQHAERVLSDEVVQDVKAGLFEMGGNVHGGGIREGFRKCNPAGGAKDSVFIALFRIQ